MEGWVVVMVVIVKTAVEVAVVVVCECASDGERGGGYEVHGSST